MIRLLYQFLSLFLLFSVLHFSYPAENINLESKVTYAGQIGLHDNDQQIRDIDYSSFINTAYIELYYNEYNMLLVEQDTSFHEQVNIGYISSFDLNGFDTISISTYSPHIIIVDEGDIKEFIDRLISISQNDKIESIYIYEEYLYLSERDPIENCTHYIGEDGCEGGGGYFPPPKGSLGEVAQTNGDVTLNTKIGMVEKKAPYFADSELSDMNWKIQSPYNTVTGLHATDVVKALKNEYTEIWEYAVFHSSADYPYQLMNSVNWLISEEVSIINISAGLDSNTTYDHMAKYFDYVSVQNNVLFVMANTNWPNHYVSYPGLSYNVLCIGAVNQNLVYQPSGYEVTFQISKPNLVDNCLRPDLGSCGTSFSTPRVSAKAARLINTYPMFKINLSLLLSVIHTSSSISGITGFSTDFDETGFDNKVGVGLLNSSSADLIMQQELYELLQFSTFPGGTVFHYKDIPVNQGGYMHVSVATLAIVTKSGLNYLFQGYAPIQLRVYVNGIIQGTYNQGNILHARFHVPSGSSIIIEVFIVGAEPNQEYDVALSWR
jgi:hypothetical protein